MSDVIRVLINIDQSLTLQIDDIQKKIKSAADKQNIIRLVAIRDQAAMAAKKAAHISLIEIKALVKQFNIPECAMPGVSNDPKDEIILFTLSDVNKTAGSIEHYHKWQRIGRFSVVFIISSVGLVLTGVLAPIVAPIVAVAVGIILLVAIIGLLIDYKLNIAIERSQLAGIEAVMPRINNIINDAAINKPQVEQEIKNYQSKFDAYKQNVSELKESLSEYVTSAENAAMAAYLSNKLDSSNIQNRVFKEIERYKDISAENIAEAVKNNVPLSIKAIIENKADEALDEIKQNAIIACTTSKFEVLNWDLEKTTLDTKAKEGLQAAFTEEKNKLLADLTSEKIKMVKPAYLLRQVNHTYAACSAMLAEVLKTQQPDIHVLTAAINFTQFGKNDKPQQDKLISNDDVDSSNGMTVHTNLI